MNKMTGVAGRQAIAKARGFPWYRAADWERLRAIATDGAKLPANYNDWMAAATRELLELKKAGEYVVKIEIPLDALEDWCRKYGFGVDARSRAEFANQLAASRK